MENDWVPNGHVRWGEKKSGYPISPGKADGFDDPQMALTQVYELSCVPLYNIIYIYIIYMHIIYSMCVYIIYIHIYIYYIVCIYIYICSMYIYI